MWKSGFMNNLYSKVSILEIELVVMSISIFFRIDSWK